MSIMLNPRARGIIGVRADASNAKAVLEELQKTFAAFKEANEEELIDLPRIIGKFDRHQYARLRLLINLINQHAPADA